MKNNISTQISCYEDKSLKPNTATYSFDKNELRFGEMTLSPKQIKDISFLFAHDLIDYGKNGGDMSNLSALNVYSFLTDLYKP